MHYDIYDSPIGNIYLVWSEMGLCRAFFEGQGPTIDNAERFTGTTNLYREAFEAYFRGEVDPFRGMPLDTNGTPFQRGVWAELLKIPAGETRCYGDLAAAMGKPNAARAVGLANNQNPVTIAVPCHRVIGKNGSLTGYAGGLDKKAWLLEHEEARLV